MTCLPDRLIRRSSSSSPSTPSRITSPSRATRRRLVDDRGLDGGAHVGQVVELRHQAGQQRRLALGQQQSQPRHRRQRLAQPDQIARAGGGQRHPRHQPLEVEHRLQRLAHLAAIGGPERQLLDRVEPIADRLERHQRGQQPGAHQPAAHRGHGAVDLVEQRSGPSPVRRLDQLEVAHRGGIHQQPAGRLAQPQRAHVRQVGLLRVAQVADQGAGGGHRARAVGQAEAVQAAHPQLIAQRLGRRGRHRSSSRPRRSPGWPQWRAARRARRRRWRRRSRAGRAPRRRRPAPDGHARRDTRRPGTRRWRGPGARRRAGSADRRARRRPVTASRNAGSRASR